VFNIAEGMHGLGREAQVPALLDACQIPYTFSDPLVMALTLHKAMTKAVVAAHDIPTPAYVVVESERHLRELREGGGTPGAPAARDEQVPFPGHGTLRFPLFVKPNAEGTGKGIDRRSIIRNRADLDDVVLDLLRRFHQPVLVESYLSGREFTVGIVGTGGKARVVGVMEVLLGEHAEAGAYTFVNKEGWVGRVTYRLVDHEPEGRLAGERALASWRVLGCRDGGRVDMRSDDRGEPNFIEVNPLAGIRPDYSDLPIVCNLAGMSWATLIDVIVQSAAERVHLRCPAARGPAETSAVASAVADRCRRGAAVLYGEVAADAAEDEKDSLREADALMEALGQLGYAAVKVPLTTDLDGVAARLREWSPEVVCNIVESVSGTGRLIHLGPALLDRLGIPFTGAGTDAIYSTSNKLMAKKILVGGGIATPPWVDLDGARAGQLSARFPLIIKSVWEHASIGLDEGSIVREKGKLLDEMLARRERLGGECFAEEYVDGREFNIALIAGASGAPEILPPAEMIFDRFPAECPKLLGYKAKWQEDSFEYHHTRRTFDLKPADAGLVARLKDVATRCWELFRLTGYARVDFRVSSDGTPYVLEVNTNPCLSPDSGFRAMLERAGIPFNDFVARLIEDCSARKSRLS
jgi:D-alanine-D-alanine ligase